MSKYLNMLSRLPDVFNKDSSSNITKLLSIITDEQEEINKVFKDIKNYRDIDKALGFTLDKIGGNVQQFRGVANDDIYRILIKAKIARNLSTGDINTIIKTLAITLNTEYQNIEVRPLYNEIASPEPAAVFVSVPTVLLNQAGFSINQFGRLVNKIVAGGVSARVLFKGSFSFSSSFGEIEIDNEKGFSDLLQTIGGSFGAVYDPSNEQQLPI